MPGMGPDPRDRRVKLFGELNEERSEQIIEELANLAKNAEEIVPKNPQDASCKEVERIVHGINFVISTYGGSVDEMFGIYDVMKYIQESVPIITLGIGKVMSAGTLILASGTKGERMIGKNCRVMIHHISSIALGTLPAMENELESVKAMEEKYINAMVKETKFTKRSLKKLLDKGVNVYLSAEEAIKYGIADKYI
jgi:ATP-dependent Clp protease protease subunit